MDSFEDIGAGRKQVRFDICFDSALRFEESHLNGKSCHVAGADGVCFERILRKVKDCISFAYLTGMSNLSL